MTGAAFALAEPYWLLLAVAFAGTLSPSAGDFSLFQPIEQAALAQTAPPARRTWLYARYSLFGSLAFALGSLLSGAAGPVAGLGGWSLEATLRGAFALYGLAGLAMLAAYRPLTPAVELAADAESEAGSFGRLAADLSAEAAKLAAGGCEWLGDRDVLAPVQAGMLKNAGRERARCVAMKRHARKLERLSARARRMSAIAAERPPEYAEALGRDSPRARKAAAAWGRAMSAANRAEAEDEDSSGSSDGGAAASSPLPPSSES